MPFSAQTPFPNKLKDLSSSSTWPHPHAALSGLFDYPYCVRLDVRSPFSKLIILPLYSPLSGNLFSGNSLLPSSLIYPPYIMADTIIQCYILPRLPFPPPFQTTNFLRLSFPVLDTATLCTPFVLPSSVEEECDTDYPPPPDKVSTLLFSAPSLFFFPNRFGSFGRFGLFASRLCRRPKRAVLFSISLYFQFPGRLPFLQGPFRVVVTGFGTPNSPDCLQPLQLKPSFLFLV